MTDIFDLFKQINTETQSREPISWLLVGLGNPGREYVFTRHNSGFLALDYISQKLNFKVDRARFSALCGECDISGRRVLAMKPQTYMNSSGEAVRDAAAFYKIPPSNILVIQDDIALEAGRMRVRRKGSDGGHNGIKSIIYQLSTDQFPRIKLGVGYPPSKDEMVNWVLGGIPENEREGYYHCIENTLGAAQLIIGGDTDGAMSQYNG